MICEILLSKLLNSFYRKSLTQNKGKLGLILSHGQDLRGNLVLGEDSTLHVYICMEEMVIYLCLNTETHTR